MTFLGLGTTCRSGPCDCNDNGIDDQCDYTCEGICAVPGCGTRQDCEGDGILDECEDPPPADLGSCCFTAQGQLNCANSTESECATQCGIWGGACSRCAKQNAGIILEPSGDIVVHVVGPAVDCNAGNFRSSTADRGCTSPFRDPWHTPADAQACHQFGVAGSPAIRAGFFGSGSDSFTGSVCLEGVSLNDPLFPGADTLIERNTDPFDTCAVPSATPPVVPIEIIALSLASVSPITVTFNGGATSSDWNVAVDLSIVPSPQGSLTVQKTHCNGGTYTSNLPVRPRFTFTEVGNPTNQTVLDTGVEGHDPIVLLQTTPAPWISKPVENLFMTIDPCSDFHPGIDEAYKDLSCDCNADSIRDECELESQSAADCNLNGTLDFCDIAAGTSQDADEDGTPDECLSVSGAG